MLFGLFCTCVVLTAIAWLDVEVRTLKQRMKSMSTSFENLKAAVAQQVTVDQSAVTLIQGIANQLKQPDADVQALADELTAASAPLAAAITANTPIATPGAVAPATGAPATAS